MENSKFDLSRLDAILEQPVLKKELFASPVMIKSLELLRYNNHYLCRVRSTDGAEGMSIGHPFQQRLLEAIFIRNLQPVFTGSDARDLETLIDQVYAGNYKLQGLALWIPLAAIEFAILDMLGHIADRSIGRLIGEIHNPGVGVYHPNNNRGRSAEESLERIQMVMDGSGVRALKFKVGGRMRRLNDPGDPVDRSEKLIPMVREAFGDEMVLYVDSNSSYKVDDAVRIGRILEEHNYDFYEEPVPFDEYEETRQVAGKLSIPIAGGEQEPSLSQFRWLIATDSLQIVQPDQYYFGGMIRSMKVARMAEACGKTCVPHLSGGGLGYLYMMHFVSALPNAGPYHEVYRNNRQTGTPVECPTSTLVPGDNGKIKVPTGPGLGVSIDPDFIKKHQIVKA
ncbi:MAG: mandelate racemase/muconate lactonizing enzyme family protein [Balneolales bacterium]